MAMPSRARVAMQRRRRGGCKDAGASCALTVVNEYVLRVLAHCSAYSYRRVLQSLSPKSGVEDSVRIQN